MLTELKSEVSKALELCRSEIIKVGGGRLTAPDENSMFTGTLQLSKIKKGYVCM